MHTFVHVCVCVWRERPKASEGSVCLVFRSQSDVELMAYRVERVGGLWCLMSSCKLPIRLTEHTGADSKSEAVK